MPSAPEDNMHEAEDTAAQIARLREQVEALMKEHITPAVADAAGAMQEHAETVAGKVREQPLLAILLAAAVGYVLGRTAR
jgi:ElaB/YqjD/DUF883 family membrane-anchored ribosome-binding protein